MNDFFYKVNDIEYPVHINYKNIKNIHYRFIDGAFVVSCNKRASKKLIISGLDKFGKGLIQRSQKPLANGEDYFYLLGVKLPFQEIGEVSFTDGSKISWKSKEEFNKKIKKFFKNYLTKRVEIHSKRMGLPLYKVSVKEMRTRFGSNSKYTKTLHFALSLMPFSSEIIDSVVIHELAHILVYNHSKAFYDVVYKYCPNYDIYRKKLLKGEFQ